MIRTLITHVIAGGPSRSDVNIVRQVMIQAIMDPVMPAEVPNDVPEIYDLLSSLGVPVHDPGGETH